jgi:hypothetical protein
MQIFRRKEEALAQEDPAAFLAQIYGNLELPPPTEGASDASAPPTSKSVVNDRFESEAKPPPAKRTPKNRKAKAAPPTSTPPTKTPPPTAADAPAPKPDAVGKVSLEIALNNTAEALEEAVEDWKRRSYEPLLEHPEMSAQILEVLEGIGEELDGIVELLRDCSRSLDS